mmetsp:Transcript_11730/g.23106  ORF Transcript_11730/g.23106 Transcript_11730/m.23106 type:complete len:111 (+) Transcript_11730:749-1081(+)
MAEGKRDISVEEALELRVLSGVCGRIVGRLFIACALNSEPGKLFPVKGSVLRKDGSVDGHTPGRSRYTSCLCTSGSTSTGDVKHMRGRGGSGGGGKTTLAIVSMNMHLDS